ncbi:MAG: heavy metal translocating P-type ATPase [Gammaproteobacteria bacterium]
MQQSFLSSTAFKFHWQWLAIGTSLGAIILSISLHLAGMTHSNWPLLFAIIFCGVPATLRIILKLFKGDLGADLLAVIAIITAVILHEYLAGVIIILMLASGEELEQYATHKASSALLALVERMPALVHLRAPAGIKDIPLQRIQIGDEIMIYPHETCPVDGVIIEGHGSMDESYLTGEPYQVSKAPGTTVFSGAINGETMLIVRAEKLVSDSRYASIVAVLQEAEQKRPKLRRLGDQIGLIFAPLTLLFAITTWLVTGNSMSFLAVLVIATPCPLLIAIPITLISAISMAAKKAIIIKDPTVLERLPTCQTAIFDKTGTLTYGKPILTEILPSNGEDINFILQIVASLERYSKHPLASAVLEKAKQHKLPLLEARHVSEKPGQGLRGSIQNDDITITNRKGLLEKLPESEKSLPDVTVGLECIVTCNNQYLATMRFRDPPRSESKSFIGHLKLFHRFKKIMLLSGDRESEVKYLGDLLNLTEIHASQTPQQKLAIVRQEANKAPTLFMGDGINDAPALTAATVGVAFGQYSNVTAESAGAVIMESTLIKVDELIHLSLITRRIALQSAIGGMTLSIIGMGFAAAGFITPVIGAILQEIIDVVAIANSLRLLWIKVKSDIPK